MKPGSPEHLKEIWLGEPGTVLSVLRGALGLPDTAPLLLAADELRKLGNEPNVGEMSDVAVDALKTLSRLSQRSFIRRAKVSTRGATYICASAYTAYDPYESVTKGSNRRVFYLPLPPLNLELWDKEVQELAKRGDVEQKIVGRS